MLLMEHPRSVPTPYSCIPTTPQQPLQPSFQYSNSRHCAPQCLATASVETPTLPTLEPEPTFGQSLTNHLSRFKIRQQTTQPLPPCSAILQASSPPASTSSRSQPHPPAHQKDTLSSNNHHPTVLATYQCSPFQQARSDSLPPCHYPLRTDSAHQGPCRPQSAPVAKINGAYPVYRPEIVKPRRRRWDPREDSLLEDLVRRYGASQWGKLARYFPGRNGRQVRLRWVNHLQPNVFKGEWTKEEEEFVLKRHREVGNRWAAIAEGLQGRTDNAVKNRFKVITRRLQKQEGSWRSSEL